MPVTTAYGYNSQSSSDNEKDGANIRRPVAAQLIANNVVDFGIAFYDENNARIFPTANSIQAFAATSQTASTLTIPYHSGTAPITGFPRYAEIMMRVLTEQGVKLMDAFERGLQARPAEYGSDAEYWWAVVDQNSRVFTRRIEIPANAL